MYYEEAKVKEYHRKNKEGVKKPYYQINLSKKSKFSEVKPIALIDVAEIEKLSSFLEANPIEEKEAEINELQEETLQLKEEVDSLKTAAEKLAAENNELKKDKIQLQEDLIIYKNHYEDKVEELTEEKEDSKKLLASIVTLTNNNKELEKENIFLKSRSLFNRIINKQYSKEIDVPEIVEAESKPSEE